MTETRSKAEMALRRELLILFAMFLIALALFSVTIYLIAHAEAEGY